MSGLSMSAAVRRAHVFVRSLIPSRAAYGLERVHLCFLYGKPKQVPLKDTRFLS